MIIGVPKEVKDDEYRVAMLPVGESRNLCSEGIASLCKRVKVSVPVLPTTRIWKQVRNSWQRPRIFSLKLI